ncbi:MAG: response regulator [Pirellulaceae bacterium]
MPKVLLVDDSAVERRLVEGLLHRSGDWQVVSAASAEEALERLAESPVDVVLTDLRMPGMDGLELLQRIRQQMAALPVVLMTAEGSEKLAVEALRLGAASYVPKPQLSTLLIEVLEDVLGLVRADRAHNDLIECMERNEVSFVLGPSPELIGPLVDLVQQMTAGVGLCDATGRVRLAMALEQALLNALFRGNLELRPEQLPRDDTDVFQQRRTQPPYCERRLHVDIALTSDEARIVVRDEGPGFDTSGAQDTSTEYMQRETERGLVLMRSFVDELQFNERGNQVTLVKRREVRAPAVESPAAPQAAVAPSEPAAPVVWGDLTTGSRVTDSISGRTYRAVRAAEGVTLSAPAGDSLTFGLDESIDKSRYRVYML